MTEHNELYWHNVWRDDFWRPQVWPLWGADEFDVSELGPRTAMALLDENFDWPPWSAFWHNHFSVLVEGEDWQQACASFHGYRE